MMHVRLRVTLAIIGVVLGIISIGAGVVSVFIGASPGKHIVKVGEIVTMNSVNATLTGVGQLTFDAVSIEDITIHVQLVNQGSSEQDYSPLDFHVKSGQGRITNLEAVPPDTYQSNNLLRAGSLTPGGSAEGDIIFQVLAGDHQAEVLWRPHGSTSETGWNLGL